MEEALYLHIPAFEELWYRQKNEKARWYEMGIVLEAKYRGMGYGTKALWLLLQHAFEELGAEAVRE